MDKEDQFYRSGIWILITLATSTFQVPKSKVSGVRSLPSEFNGNTNLWNKFIVTTLLQDSAVSIRILILYPQISADGRGFLVARLPSNIAELPAELLQTKTRDLKQI